MRLRSQIAALCLAALATPLSARPFTADDLLNAEEFGQVGFTPDGGHLVFERLIPQAQAGPFDQDIATGYRRSRLYVVDLRRGGPALPLLPAAPGEGQVAGPVSPDGARMVVLRFVGDRYEAGVVTFETGEVRWLAISPELGWLGQTIVWRGSEALLIAARPEGEAPVRLRTGRNHREDLVRLWAATASGEEPAAHVVGSGRHLKATPPAANGALVLADVRSGRIRRLADGEFYDLELSPDGLKLAAMQRLEAIQAPADWPLQVAGDYRRRNLLVADLVTGEVLAPCPRCHLSTHLIAWSPNSREVLVYGETEGPYRGAPGYLRLGPGVTARPVRTQGLDPVIDRTSEGYAIPRAAWLDGAPLILARSASGGRADWWRLAGDAAVNLTRKLLAAPGPLAGRHGEAMVLAAGGAAWRVGPTGRVQRLFSVATRVPATALGASSRQKLNVSDGRAWFRTPGTKATPSALRASDGARIALEAAPGRTLALVAGRHGAARVRRDPAGPLSLELLRPARRPQVLLQLNEAFLAVDFAQTLLLPAENSDDRHVLLLPPHLPAGARPPLVVIPYPGLTYKDAPEPYGRVVGRFSANAEVLAGAGYAVLLPSLPRVDPEPGAGLAEQMLAAVDRAAATDLVDTERLAVFGHSFGGYAALMGAAQSPRFKAVIASGAPTDLAAIYGAFDPHLETRPQDGINLNANFGWAELGQAGLKVPPWRDPELYRRNSPVALADRIDAPVLLIHGDADFIRLTQAQAMFAGLYRQSKAAELVTYFGEGHIVSSPANLRDMYRRITVWLGDSLKPPGSPAELRTTLSTAP